MTVHLMDVFEAIQKMRSIRKYLNRPVEKEKNIALPESVLACAIWLKCNARVRTKKPVGWAECK